MTIRSLIDKISSVGNSILIIEVYDTNTGEIIFNYVSDVDDYSTDMDKIFHRKLIDFSISSDFVNKRTQIKIDV